MVRKEWLECKGGGKVFAQKVHDVQMLKTPKTGEKNRLKNPTLIKKQVPTYQQSANIKWK